MAMADPNRSSHHHDNNNNNNNVNDNVNNNNNDDRFFGRLTFDQVYTRTFGLFVDRLDLFLTISASVDDWAAFLIGSTIASLVGIVGHAAIARAVAESYVVRTTTTSGATTRPPPDTLWRCLRRGLERNFFTIFCGRVLVGMASLLAVALFVVIILLNGPIVAVVLAVGAVPLYLFVMLAVTTVFVPIVVIENKPAVEGLRRSFALVSKDVCHVLLTSLGMTLLLNLIGGGLTVWIRTVLGQGLIATALAKLPFLVQFPLSSICNVVIYSNLRVIHEDLHRDGLARELSASTDADAGDGDYQYDRLEDDEEEAGAIVAEEFGTTTHDDEQGAAANVDPLISSHTMEPCLAVSAVGQTVHDVLAREPIMTNTITTRLGDSDGDRDLAVVETQAVCIAEEVKVYIP